MSALINGSTGRLRVQEFRSSGTWTNPGGVKTVSLFMVGAGGGLDASTWRAGQGGNVVEINYDVSGKSSCAVVIGAGVAAGDGGDTTFDGVAIAKGGKVSGAYSAASAPASWPGFVTGRCGFGGNGVCTSSSTLPQLCSNGAAPAMGGAANTGAGSSQGGATAGGSGYLRVEWYE